MNLSGFCSEAGGKGIVCSATILPINLRSRNLMQLDIIATEGSSLDFSFPVENNFFPFPTKSFRVIMNSRIRQIQSRNNFSNCRSSVSPSIGAFISFSPAFVGTWRTFNVEIVGTKFWKPVFTLLFTPSPYTLRNFFLTFSIIKNAERACFDLPSLLSRTKNTIAQRIKRIFLINKPWNTNSQNM